MRTINIDAGEVASRPSVICRDRNHDARIPLENISQQKNVFKRDVADEVSQQLRLIFQIFSIGRLETTVFIFCLGLE